MVTNRVRRLVAEVRHREEGKLHLHRMGELFHCMRQ